MKNLSLLLIYLISFFIVSVSFSQKEYEEKECHSIIYLANNEKAKPSKMQNTITEDQEINAILGKFSINRIVQARPESKNPRVRDLYIIELKNNSNINGLYKELKNTRGIEEVTLICEEFSSESFRKVGKDGECSSCISNKNVLMNTCPNPMTYNDSGLQNGNDWFLTGMNVPCAWTITEGNPNITVAIVDLFFNNSHQDLQGKFTSINSCNPIYNACGHGFASAGAAAAIVNNNLCSAGTGNKTKVAGYCVATSCNTGNPRTGILQAYNAGHKIINVSFSGTGLTPTEAQDMINNGVTLVVSGRGYDHNSISSIKGVINVGQADINRNHQAYNPQTNDHGIDIYALCLNVLRLQSNNQCLIGSGNSSFGAPSIAGIVALMKDVNPCLTPEDIEHIIKVTHGGLPLNASNFPPGIVVNGIIDAYSAVQMAQNYQGTNLVIDQNTTFSNDQVISGDLTVETGAQLTINSNATIKFNSNSRITVKRGAKLEVDGATLTINCGNRWRGIFLEGNPQIGQAISPFVMPSANQAGTVVLVNGATISHAQEGIQMLNNQIPWPAYQYYHGGLVYANNANFLNCRRACEFMKNDGNENSKFINCNFVTEKHGVTIWRSHGIEFRGNTFSGYSHSAIGTSDARIIVVNNNIFNGSTYSKSIDLVQTTSNSTGGSEILNNTFNSGQYGVYAQAANNNNELKIQYNNFNSQYYGTFISGTSRYNIFSNIFNQNSIGSYSLSTSESVLNFIDKNTYNNSSNTVSQYFEANNGGTLFRVNCHNFGSNHNVVCYSPASTLGKVYPFQRNSSTKEAGNYFTRGNAQSSFRLILHSWGGTWQKFSYYILSGTDHTSRKNPTLSTSAILDKFFTSTVASDECGSFRPNYNSDIASESVLTPVSDNNDNKSLLKSRINILKTKITDIENTLDDSDELNIVRAELINRECSLRDMKKLEISNQQDINKLISFMDEFLSDEDWDIKIHYFSTLVNRNEFLEAEKFLKQIKPRNREEEEFIMAQQIHLEWLANPKDYKLSKEKRVLLYEFGTNLYPSSGYIRGIYSTITGDYIKHDHPMPDEIIEKRTIDEDVSNTEFTIAPNPSDEVITITFTPIEILQKVTISSLSGELIKALDIYPGSSSIEVDISEMNSGVYMVQYSKNGDTYTKKFIKL